MNVSSHTGSPPRRGADLRWVLALVALAAALRTWQIHHTEVVSRDCIGYIRIAWRLEHGNWLEVFPTSAQHPLYPITVLATSLPVRHLLGGDLPRVMELSAQLASALASVLLVVPMFYLGRELFDRRVGFWAAALFQCLPASGRVMGDGLSEPLFLLCAAAGLLFAVRGLRSGSVACFALTGLASALAYLTRPEGAVVAGAAGLVLLAAQAVSRWRRSWAGVFRCGAVLTAAALAAALPFMWVIGGFTVKTTGNYFLNSWGPGGPRQPYLRQQTESQPAREPAYGNGVATSPALLALWFGDIDKGPQGRALWAFEALGFELAKAFFYALWVPALAGLWWFRERFRLVPGAWVLLLVSLLVLAALYRVAAVMGYLSERHTLLILLCGTYCAVAAVDVIARWLAARFTRLQAVRVRSFWTNGRAWSLALLCALCAAPLGRTLQTLHAERKGFRTVGYWLAEHLPPDHRLVDPYCWASYYAGRVFQEEDGGPRKVKSPVYVVLEKSRSRHAKLIGLPEAEALAAKGAVIHTWYVKRGKEKAEIKLYEVCVE